MCDPISIISAVALVGGSVMQNMGMQQAANARTSVTNAQTRLQKQHQDAEHAAFQSSLDMSQPDKVKASAEADAAARAAAYAPKAITPDTAMTSGQQSGMSEATRNSVVGDAERANTDATRVAGGRATMGGTGDAFRDLSFAMQPNVDKIAMESNFSKGDAAIFPLELEQANRAGSGLRSFGSLFSSLGGAGLGAGLGGASGIASGFNNAVNGLWGGISDLFSLPGYTAQAAQNVANGAAGI